MGNMDERRTETRVDPVDLSVYLHAMRSIAEEMGTALRRTAASPNIKERRDYSCAVFDGQARVLAMGDHMPVHLGSMPMSVEAAARARDSDVGGMYPGSMGPAREVFQEGLRIPPVRLVREGELDRETLALLLANVRTTTEREGDLQAQIGACRVGETRLMQMAEGWGAARLGALGKALLDYSERLMRSRLRDLPAGEFS